MVQLAAYSSTTVPNPTFPYYKLAAKGGQINLIQSLQFTLRSGTAMPKGSSKSYVRLGSLKLL